MDVLVEHEWLAAHPDVFKKHVGEWIAIAGERIIASSESLVSLKQKLFELRVNRPLVFLVPRADEEFSLL